jgi:DNA polymerase elongation subunit (family B)
MTREEKIKRIEEIKKELSLAKRDSNYYNAMQLAIKLCSNSCYGAISNSYFPAFAGSVASSITAMGRDVIQYAAKYASDYLENDWQKDTDLHEYLSLTEEVKPIQDPSKNIVYIDTDSAFVNFKQPMESCKWIQNGGDGLEFVQKMDKFRMKGLFTKGMEEYANKFGVTNLQDFELERINESSINIAKKKYIQHIVWEDGVPYDRLKYFYPKGVELVRSSTPIFARERIPVLIKYLFQHPETFNIKELIGIIRGMRKEFELVNIEDISGQSSCSNYETKILDDRDSIQFVKGTHFAVKAAAYYNHMLHKNALLQNKYEFLKSGTKIKFYYTKDDSIGDIFGYMKGMFPIEFAPNIDYDTQFAKTILSPINSLIEPLGMPEISKRLSVVVGLFNNLNKVKKAISDEEEDPFAPRFFDED